MFMTPRGLKIRVDVPMGFALLARLWTRDPDIDARRVLRTVEGLENIPSLLGIIGGMAGLLFGPSWWPLVAGLIAGRILGAMLTMFGAFVIPGLPTLATWWSLISGYGLVTASLVAFAWWARGSEYAVAWAGGTVLASVVAMFVIEPMRVRYYFRKIGHALTQSEINFFNAYRLHAHRLDLGPSIEVDDGEYHADDWRRCLDDYTAKCPHAIVR